MAEYTQKEIISKILSLKLVKDNLSSLEETPANLAQAQAAAALIQKLLTKYNLSMAAVDDHDTNSKNSYLKATKKYSDYQTQYDGNFSFLLIRAVAEFNFCTVVNEREYKASNTKSGYSKVNFGFSLIGKKHNIDMALYLFDYCLNNVKLLFNRYYEERRLAIFMKRGTGKFYVHRRAFYEGAVNAIYLTLQEEREDSKSEFSKQEVEPKGKTTKRYENFEDQGEVEVERDEDDNIISVNGKKLESGENNKLMVLLNKTEEELEQAKQDFYGDRLRTKKISSSRDAEGKYFGYIAGKKLQLRKGLDEEQVERNTQKLLS